jgi:hypothetical protein
MSSKASEVLAIIKNEADRSRNVQDAFVRAHCLLETHYSGRPSSLLEVYPKLRGQNLSETEVAEFNQALFHFIDEVPAHDCVTLAVKLLSLSKDKSLRRFFVDQLRKHVAWRTSAVVFQLLLALEDLGEEVFLDAHGKLIQSRSSNAFEVNLDVANRYLKKHDKSR